MPEPHPRARRAGERIYRADAGDRPVSHGKGEFRMRLLIVDDDMPTVEAIRRAIDWNAVEIDAVDTAYSAAQARRVLRRGQTDIVISDIEMPQGSGLNLLSWVRAQEMDVEFLFLTCHERFDYAKSALKLDAAEYLTKPFNARLMSLSLQKTVAKIKEKRRLLESSRYGEWRLENPQQEELNFWLSLFSGIAMRKPRTDPHGRSRRAACRWTRTRRYRLVATRVMEYEPQGKELGQSFLFYILENTHSRLLCGGEENGRTVHRFGVNGLWFFTAVDDDARRRTAQPLPEGDRRLRRSRAREGDLLHRRRSMPIEALADQPAALQIADRAQRRLLRPGVHRGRGGLGRSGDARFWRSASWRKCCRPTTKVALLNTVKNTLADRTALKTLSERTLYLIQQEFLQAVYAHLSEAGVQATRLFSDEDSVRLSDQACRSSVDMLRWANYLLERTFDFEDDLRKAGTLVERMQAYIREHYHEDIGRNEIAAEFHLSPEYLAKLFKRKTHHSLKDAVWDQRMEQAKRLLYDPDSAHFGDVAGAVGIDNLSYFTTCLKSASASPRRNTSSDRPKSHSPSRSVKPAQRRSTRTHRQ